MNLRKANAIQHAIKEELRSLKLGTRVVIDDYDQSPTETLTAANVTFANNLKTREALTDVLYAIRKAVSNANTTAGINDLLADVARIDSDIKFYGNLASQDAMTSADSIKGQQARNQDSTGISRLSGTITSSILVDAEIKRFQDRVKKLKRDKQAVQDRLLDLNVKTEIELSGDHIKTLQENGLL